MPFAVAARDGVLRLTLDTPGSPVNIFNHATARQLTEILAGVRPEQTRAIVLDSAKPGSFLNGVGLLLAHASQTRAALVAASMPPWTAYRALHETPVPTIAVVDGTCFGCGVELSLLCDYRIASTNAETRFYMTELNDYLFVPLFGSTWTLPAAVGLDDAIDLLLWGARWDGETAARHGLADAVVEPDRTDAAIAAVLAGRMPSRRRGRVVWGDAEERAVARARARIAALPPSHHPVYGDALDLLVGGARQPDSLVAHQQRELDRSAASALADVGKSAYSFFYLRQMASERALGRGPLPAGGDLALGLGLDPAGAARGFVEGLRARPLSGVRFVAPDDAELCLVEADGGAPPAPDAPHGDGPQGGAPDRGRGHARRPGTSDPARSSASVTLQLASHPGPRHPLALCAPTVASGGRLIELAVAPDADAGLSARLARALQRWGFEVARTAPGETFVCHRLLRAFLAPLARHRNARAVNTTLRHAGFVRRPHALLAALAASAPGGLDDARHRADVAAGLGLELEALAGEGFDDGPGEPLVLDALAVSLLDAVLAVRASGQARDAIVIDLIARELLDFPLTLRSLCTWLRRDRLARALAHADALAGLVPAGALASARRFVAEGREFYRGGRSAAA